MVYDLAYHFEQGKQRRRLYTYFVHPDDRPDFLTALKQELDEIRQGATHASFNDPRLSRASA